MELKKNDRVMYDKRLGTVMSDLGYYKVITKDTWIDALLDGEEFICQIRKDYLKKVNNDIPTYDNQTYIEMPKIKINATCEASVKQIAKDIVDRMKKDEKILTENKLHNLDTYKNISTSEMMLKLAEECYEVHLAIKNDDMENLSEELLDVMQCCLGVAYTKNIKLDEHMEKHNMKLISRGHKFI